MNRSLRWCGPWGLTLRVSRWVWAPRPEVFHVVSWRVCYSALREERRTCWFSFMWGYIWLHERQRPYFEAKPSGEIIIFQQTFLKWRFKGPCPISPWQQEWPPHPCRPGAWRERPTDLEPSTITEGHHVCPACQPGTLIREEGWVSTWLGRRYQPSVRCAREIVSGWDTCLNRVDRVK